MATLQPVGWRPLLALLPLLAVLLGGATARWSQAVVLTVLGVVLLVAPPRRGSGRALNVVLGLLILLAFMAFLPARWFSLPPWRTALTEDFGVTLPAVLSPQPWLSAESIVLFLAGAGWFYLMVTLRWTVEERVRAGRVYAGGVILLATVFVTFYKLNIVVPFWLNTRHFGPFPNRNQTADFLAVGALPVLGCAHASWRAGRRPAAVCWLVGWLVVAVAVFNNFSRAGIGILFAGSGIYLVMEAIRTARRRRPPRREVKEGDPLPDRAIAISRWRRGALVVSLLLMLGSGFFLFGGDTLGRFQFDSVAGAESVVTDEFRTQIQRDAVRMTTVSPWCGVGLGNFAPTFAVSRRLSASPAWLIHPESDWLWMAVELGWLAPALTLAGLFLLARRVLPYKQGKDRPLRVAATMATALFALHGFVDVSAHRLGTALCGLFLLGLALPGERPRHENDAGDETVFPPISGRLAGGFRAFGVALVGVGLWWGCEAAGWITAPGELGVARLKALAATAGSVGDYAGAERAATRALAWAPLDWQLYFARATARVCLRRDLPAALEDFRRARYLQPFAGDPCFTEASFWAAANESALAVSALVEACRREPDRATGYISDVANIAAEGKTAFRERLLPALRRDPDLELSFLRSLDPPDMGPVIAAVIKNDPGLRAFSGKEKQAFFYFWQLGGDANTLATAMKTHLDWQLLGWRAWARACAELDQPERACSIARRYAPKPAVPPEPPSTGRSLTELQADALRSPTDPVPALHLYFAEHAAGDTGAALVALHRITLEPGCPPYFYYLEACRAGELSQWSDGWHAWEKYLDETGKDG